MAKHRRRSAGPQSLATQAQYLWNQRRVTIWIPFLNTKIEQLERRMSEKGTPVQHPSSALGTGGATSAQGQE